MGFLGVVPGEDSTGERRHQGAGHKLFGLRPPARQSERAARVLRSKATKKRLRRSDRAASSRTTRRLPHRSPQRRTDARRRRGRWPTRRRRDGEDQRQTDRHRDAAEVVRIAHGGDREVRSAVVAADDADRERLERTILAGLPGGAEGLTREAFLRVIDSFSGLTEGDMRIHLSEFLEEICPVAEEVGSEVVRVRWR